jgi:putative protease
MNIQRENIELTAPVGSFESLSAAIKAGADSVYFGIGRMNMRAKSSVNFSLSDLSKIMRICRQFKKKAYLALNIDFFDEELGEVKKVIDLAAEQGVHAIIAFDQAVIKYAFDKGLGVHLSTQVNITNTESLKFYAAYAEAVVLARELNLDQINEICKNIQREKICGPSGHLMKVEIFAHGALCMAVSGKCYLSLHNHHHSANRGECLQDCRRSYIVREKESGMELDIENQYIMSPKDLCTIHFLNKIVDAGVKILKIEGRARSPEYVKTVTECYQQALCCIADGTYSKEKIDQWKVRLSGVFNRGFWEGYYLGKRLGAWSEVYGSKAYQTKSYVAKCTNYFTRIHVAEFKCESGGLIKGDKILIIGPTTGVVEASAFDIHVELTQVEHVKPGERFSIALPTKVRRGDKLYKLIQSKTT